eukprot:8700846-Prorocentrum_lima.AAC.1
MQLSWTSGSDQHVLIHADLKTDGLNTIFLVQIADKAHTQSGLFQGKDIIVSVRERLEQQFPDWPYSIEVVLNKTGLEIAQTKGRGRGRGKGKGKGSKTSTPTAPPMGGGGAGGTDMEI